MIIYIIIYYLVGDEHPWFSNRLTTISVLEGEDVMLTCRVENCGDCGIVWFRKEISVESYLSSNVERQERVVSRTLEDAVWTSTILIKNITLIDASSKYLCVILWRNLTFELSFNLRHLNIDTTKAPYIDKSLSYKLLGGCSDYCILHCPLIMMEGQSNNSVVEWTPNGDEWNVSWSANNSIIGEYSTIIHDEGAYTCRASNTLGSDAIEIFIDLLGKIQLCFLQLMLDS